MILEGFLYFGVFFVGFGGLFRGIIINIGRAPEPYNAHRVRGHDRCLLLCYGTFPGRPNNFPGRRKLFPDVQIIVHGICMIFFFVSRGGTKNPENAPHMGHFFFGVHRRGKNVLLLCRLCRRKNHACTTWLTQVCAARTHTKARHFRIKSLLDFWRAFLLYRGINLEGWKTVPTSGKFQGKIFNFI